MRMTQRTDLAVRGLIVLAERWPDTVSVATAATTLQVPANHLMKALQDLRRAGVLESVRGKAGGHRLARPPSEINLGAVVRALEPIALVECFRSDGGCALTSHCKLAGVFERAVNAFVAELDAVSLSDLVGSVPPRLTRLRRPRGAA